MKRLRLTFQLLLILLLVVGLAPINAQAAPLVREFTADFESGVPAGWETWGSPEGMAWVTVTRLPLPVLTGDAALQQRIYAAGSRYCSAGLRFLPASNGTKYEIEGWVYVDRRYGAGMMRTAMYIDFPTGEAIRFDGLDTYMTIRAGSAPPRRISSGLPMKRWHNLRMTYDPTSDRFDLMLNGAYLARNESANVGGQAPVSLNLAAAGGWTSGNNMTQYVDDVAVRVTSEQSRPPEITIVSPEGRDYPHNGSLSPDYSVVDPDSDLVSVEVRLDGQEIDGSAGIKLLDLSLGSHTFTVTARASADNVASKSVVFDVVASVDSLAASVGELAEAGLINTPNLANSLEAKIRAAAASLARGQRLVGARQLEALSREILAQSGKHIAESAADLLLKDIDYVIMNL